MVRAVATLDALACWCAGGCDLRRPAALRAKEIDDALAAQPVPPG